MRVLILHNEPVLPAGHPEAAAEQAVVDSVQAVEHLLRRGQHEVTTLGVGRELGQIAAGVAAVAPDLVFNLFEGLADEPRSEVAVARILETSGVPFTGSPSAALARAGSKAWTKQRLRQAGLPTPAGFVVARLPPPPCPLGWPVILKPVFRHASEGIDQGSVVDDPASYRRRIEQLCPSHGPVLVEEYLPGRELMVTVFEGINRDLPLIGYRFRDPQCWPIASYDGKWTPGSADYEAYGVDHDVAIPRWQADQLRRLARRAFHALGCRDYARIDLRLRRDGRPAILDVNANCDLGPVSFLAQALRGAGISPEEYMNLLVSRSRQRPRGRLETA